MRPITKEPVLATEYKAWVDAFDQENKDHPAYSSGHKYYKDVVANLMWIQKGLCAYTEMFLIDPNHVRPELWKNGRFPEIMEGLGELDHYDSELKKAKGWDWDNFFMILDKINLRKGTKTPQILKPDVSGFDPFYYLDYDMATHYFKTNPERNEDDTTMILADIDTLGLNYGAVVSLRKHFLSPIIEEVNYQIGTVEEARIKINRFYTAFEMAIAKISM